ncbi:hypothetical protein BC628DRAFT_551245 [Trametes gibbosa]|nr:hypothetical protein BC628DRAFT_551245 [Trametes gibbosa]
MPSVKTLSPASSINPRLPQRSTTTFVVRSCLPARRAFASSLLHSLGTLCILPSLSLFPLRCAIIVIIKFLCSYPCYISIPPCSSSKASSAAGASCLVCRRLHLLLLPHSSLPRVYRRSPSAVFHPLRPIFPSCPYPVRIRIQRRTRKENKEREGARAVPASPDLLVSPPSRLLFHTCFLPPLDPLRPLVVNLFRTIYHPSLSPVVFSFSCLFSFIFLFPVSILSITHPPPYTRSHIRTPIRHPTPLPPALTSPGKQTSYSVSGPVLPPPYPMPSISAEHRLTD